MSEFKINELENDKDKQEAKWYIATTTTGFEEEAYKNIQDKVKAYLLGDVVKEMRLLKSREITIEIFDSIHNPPPKIMRNSKISTWEALPGNRYKKTTIKTVNRFPGYIYIKMIMLDDAWYTIRNTYGVTGFIGSSGKGAKPIPMSDFEVEKLFDLENNKDIIINKTPDLAYVEQSYAKEDQLDRKVEFLSSSEQLNIDGYFDSNLKNNELVNDDLNESTSVEKQIEKEALLEQKEYENEYLENHSQNVEVIEVEQKTQENKKSYQEIENAQETIGFDEGRSDQKDSSFIAGSSVMITSGSWKDAEGKIISIDSKNKKLKLLIDVFGRDTEIEVLFDEVSKDF